MSLSLPSVSTPRLTPTFTGTVYLVRSYTLDRLTSLSVSPSPLSLLSRLEITLPSRLSKSLYSVNVSVYGRYLELSLFQSRVPFLYFLSFTLCLRVRTPVSNPFLRNGISCVRLLTYPSYPLLSLTYSLSSPDKYVQFSYLNLSLLTILLSL